MLALPIFLGERWERRQRRIQRPERVAAVEKIEDQRKPDDFFGHRNRKANVLSRRGNCPVDSSRHKKSKRLTTTRG